VADPSLRRTPGNHTLSCRNALSRWRISWKAPRYPATTTLEVIYCKRL